jgi:ubiquinone/menaquinone biosynthesis C-methylase UbiE
MKTINSSRVCQVEKAGLLNVGIRKTVHNPAKILKGLIKEGTTMLDFGCGPGFFTIEAAKLVGDSGKIIAADLQQGMLDIVKKIITGSSLDSRIQLHKCDDEAINLSLKVDFVLIFWVLHEVPSQESFFCQIVDILKPGGKILLVEPKFHVKKKDFNASIEKAQAQGLKIIRSEKIFFSRSVLLEKN